MAEEKIKIIFHSLDVNKNGVLTFDEIETSFKAKGLAFDVEKFKKVFAELDVDKDGKLNLAEFLAVKNPPYLEDFKPYAESLLK